MGILYIDFLNINFFPEMPYNPGCAPSVLILFINMMLFKHTAPQKGCEEYMFVGQDKLQLVLVMLSLLCVPVLLLGKPIHELCVRRRHAKAVSN